jgi:hypothetical protein
MFRSCEPQMKYLITISIALWGIMLWLGYLSLTNNQGGEYWLVNLPLGVLTIITFFCLIPFLVIRPFVLVFFRNQKWLKVPYAVLCVTVISGLLFNSFHVVLKPYQFWFSVYTVLLVFNILIMLIEYKNITRQLKG